MLSPVSDPRTILADHIADFLASRAASTILGTERFRDPEATRAGALGAIYIGLAPGLTRGIRHVGSYVRKYAPHFLRQYLRELREMRPFQEDKR